MIFRDLRGGVSVQPIIQPSSALRNNYQEISQLCRTEGKPVFLTRNGRGDTVLMDIETYARREEELLDAQRLIDAQVARLNGGEGYSVDELDRGLQIAIEQGAARAGSATDDSL